MSFENHSTTVWTVDKLKVYVAHNREQMGKEAAHAVADCIRKIQGQKETVNMIFASAPSQNEFLRFLSAADGIDWNRINAFHMDEYIGLSPEASQNFATFLQDRLFSIVEPRNFFRINGNAADISDEKIRYRNLLDEYPVDIICMGIGENCHIAFNDPHVADFNDPEMIKVVELDHASREQQVNDGCFAVLPEVPTHALTLTIPALMRPPHLYCIVPGPLKATAVRHTLEDAVTTEYPSTILRTHSDAHLFIDRDAASGLEKY